MENEMDGTARAITSNGKIAHDSSTMSPDLDVSIPSTPVNSNAKSNGSTPKLKKENGSKPSGSKTKGGSSQSRSKTPQSKDPSKGEAAPKPDSPTASAATSISAGSMNKTYMQLVHEAIEALNDRSGSSIPAISKYIFATYPSLDSGPYYKSRLMTAIKNGMKSKRFVKVKCSYKISSDFKEKERARRKKAAAQAKKSKLNQQTPSTDGKSSVKKEAEKMEDDLSPEAVAKAKAAQEKREELARQRAEEEAKAKERAERLRRRRFPMEDTRLHAEDRELGVKPPADVGHRPNLPYFWHMTLPFNDPSRKGKTSSSILQASKVDMLDLGNRGLVSDLLQVYHFFRGDVRCGGVKGLGEGEASVLVPEFSLQHLVYSVDQILSGNAKRTRSVPPLICHLFVTCLQILCGPPTPLPKEQSTSTTARSLEQLSKDLHKFLWPALNQVSWGHVCFLYMDAMDRYYATDSSVERNILQPLPIDADYLFGYKEEPSAPPPTPGPLTQTEGQPNSLPLPERYPAYLGDTEGILYKAHDKLGRQDPWMLSAEELMCLLRALTDDIMATQASIGDNIAAREEQMVELVRAKKAAEAKFRKVRLAFEGPKKPQKKTALEADSSKSSAVPKQGDSQDVEADTKHGGDGEASSEKGFKPSATKKQFEAAKRSQQKAVDAYEKGVQTLVARTEPVGYDRNFTAVYCFKNDPEVLYVEEQRPSSSALESNIFEALGMHFKKSSWHVIESTSLFDAFVSSLDLRGKRENALYEELLGSNQTLRSHLYDDVKLQMDIKAKQTERSSLQKRLEIARRRANEEQSRRSGRLAGQSAEELSMIEGEIASVEEEIKSLSYTPVRNIDEMTGMHLLRKFDASTGVDKKRTREKSYPDISRGVYFPCSKLVPTGNIDGSGQIGMIVADLLEIEELCESVAPWERCDLTRGEFISKIEGAIFMWDGAHKSHLNGDHISSLNDGTRYSTRDSIGSSSSNSKRRKSEGSAQTAPPASTIISSLKQPLLDLEARLADLTNVIAATRDTEIADENMSVEQGDEDQTNRERLEKGWRKIVHRIRQTSARRHVQIREMLVQAIAAARKAHRPDVVSQLREALLQHQPTGAGDCKKAAIAVLEAHGGYDANDDEDEDDEGKDAEDAVDYEIPSVISMDSAILTSFLEGSDDATRTDWIEAVKSCKTVSRLAGLVAAFAVKAKKKLKQVQVERDTFLSALATWERSKGRAPKKVKPSSSKDSEDASEVWANVRLTDEICMAKAENYPWWPAKKCEPKDPSIAMSLSSVNRVLVALIGEMGGLRVVRSENIRPFTGDPVEEEQKEGADAVEISKELRLQLEECMTMARRILRGKRRGEVEAASDAKVSK